MNWNKLYLKFCNAVVFVEVIDEKEKIGCGTAFHLGEGVFLTAKHVLENKTIRAIRSTTRGYYQEKRRKLRIGQTKLRSTVIHRSFDRNDGTLELGPFLSERNDLAVFTATGIDAPSIPLSLATYDPFFDDDELALEPVLIMGYPPIPFSDGPRLLASTAEVNSVIDKYTGGPPQLIISAIPRGGFSGGPCLDRSGEALGVIIESLHYEGDSAESGFMSVLSVKPITWLLAEYNLVPEIQAPVVSFNLFNWRRPEDPRGMSYMNPDSIVQRTKGDGQAKKESVSQV